MSYTSYACVIHGIKLSHSSLTSEQYDDLMEAIGRARGGLDVYENGDTLLIGYGEKVEEGSVTSLDIVDEIGFPAFFQVLLKDLTYSEGYFLYGYSW